jgi:hypothetical protein
VFTAVTMNNVVYLVVMPYGFRRFGGTCRLQSINRLTLFLAHVISLVLTMEATRSTETSVYIKATRRHIILCLLPALFVTLHT